MAGTLGDVLRDETRGAEGRDGEIATDNTATKGEWEKNLKERKSSDH
jgi:hypothetical protein